MLELPSTRSADARPRETGGGVHLNTDKWQLRELEQTQESIAKETAKLAQEVQRLSKSVRESAERVDAIPELLDGTPGPTQDRRELGAAAETNGAPGTNTQAKAPNLPADADGIKWSDEKTASTTYTSHYPTTAGATTPMKIDWAPLAELTAPQNIERMSSEGDFPRPETNTLARNSGPNGEVAHSGRVPNAKWATVYVDEEKRDAVRDAMRDAYNAYETYAMGYDELQPLTKRGKNAFGGLGATVIDSLDTLWIMGLKDQYSRARNWVADRLHFDRNYEASVFETTIRVVGGLIAAHDLSGDEMYLAKCLDLVRHLKPAFSTETGIPYNIVNLKKGWAKNPTWSRGASTLAEFGTLQMEYIALSERTGDDEWRQLAESIVETVRKIRTQTGTPLGLYPLYLNPHRGTWENTHVSFGAMGDSWYEYLLKVWVQGGRTKAMKGWHDMWEESMRAMIDKLVFDGEEEGTKYVAEYNANHAVHKMDHLTCFVGGMLVLGSHGSDHEDEYMKVAAAITKMCWRMYSTQPTGIAPEFVNFQDKKMHVGGKFNIQRPEAIEAIFYMYRKTGDPVYREWAWEMFTNMRRHYRTETGWVGLKDVRSPNPGHDNTMQSFFLAETLKYFYLIFSDSDTINLDEWVLNTEAHPIRVMPRDKSDVGTN